MKKWMPLFMTQFLGVLNDNFLKNLICFIGITWLPHGKESLVITLASVSMVLPYLFFGPISGRLAQIHSKMKILNYAKLAEIPIMVLAVFGFYTQSIVACLIANFLMGLQSAIYSPSKYGLIRDVGGLKGLSFGTGTMELLTFIAILVGTAMGGKVSDSTNHHLFITGALIGIAVLGWWCSKNIRVSESKVLTKVKPTVNPLKFLVRNIRWSRRNVKGLNTTVLGLGTFWFIGSMIQMNLLVYGPQVLQVSNSITSLIITCMAVGIGVGCWVAGVLSRGRVEVGLAPIGAMGLSICLGILSFQQLNILPFTITLTLAAFFSGFFKVPLNAWLQERVKGRKLGEILAYNNMVVFSCIFISAGVFYLTNVHLGPQGTFKVITLITVLVTGITVWKVPGLMLRFIFLTIAHSLYKIEVIGEENVPRKTGALIIANHLSLMDSFLLVAAVPRMMRFVMMEKVYKLPVLGRVFRKLHMIPVSSKRSKNALKEFNRRCQKEIEEGHVVCIFPEGQISRIGQTLEFKKGMEHIASDAKAPIVPIYMDGLDGTMFTYEKQNGKLIWPKLKFRRTEVTLTIGEPLPAKTNSFEARDRVEELSVSAFEKRFNKDQSLAGCFIDGIRKNRKNKLTIEGNTYSFKEVGEMSLKLAIDLKKMLKGHQKVAIVANTSLESIILNYALILLGKTVVNVPTDVKKSVAEQMIMQSGASFLFCNIQLNVPEVVQRPLSSKANKSDLFSSKKERFFGSKKKVLRLLGNTKKPEDISFLNVPETTLNCTPFSSKNVLASIRSVSELYRIDKMDALLCNLPLSELNGLIFKIWAPIILGVSVVESENENPTILIGAADGVEQTIAKMSPQGISQLKLVHVGQEPLKKSIIEALDTKTLVSKTLVIPEFGSLVATNRSDYIGKDLSGKEIVQKGILHESVGRPLPGTAVKVIDPKTGVTLGHNTEGVLAIKSNAIFEPYIQTIASGLSHFNQGWYITSIYGWKDKSGFINISNQV